MEPLQQLLNSADNLAHHAYAFVAQGKGLTKKLLSFLKEKLGVEHRGNPDVFVQSYETLTIDDARGLKDSHATRPFAENGKKIFILEADSITHEAQNALLKIFEEPNDYAHFFLIIHSEESLLPTLRSRLFMVRGSGVQDEDEKVDKNLANFLSGTKAERITQVDKLAADISDGKKAKSAALEFCAALSRHLRNDGVEKNAKALAAVAQTESYLRDRAPSVKQLLEYVALSV